VIRYCKRVKIGQIDNAIKMPVIAAGYFGFTTNFLFGLLRYLINKNKQA
jgi:hypothetical protein